MNIEDVLDNLVCRNHLLSFVAAPDLLRMRKVSSSIKIAAEDFIRTQKVQNAQPLKIDFQKDLPFESFFKFQASADVLPRRTSLAMSNFKNIEQTFTMRTLLQSFVDTGYTTNVTSLSLHKLVVPLYSEKMFQFFDSFPNLTSLELNQLLPHAQFEDEGQEEPAQHEIIIPTCLKNLKRLEINDAGSVEATPSTRNSLFTFCVKLVEKCISNMELLCLPFEDFEAGWKVDGGQVMGLVCKCLLVDQDVKLGNMSGMIIEDLFESDYRTGEMESAAKMINDKVVSILDPQTMTFLLKLPNVEKIDFGYFNYVMPNPGFTRPDWPKLKEIIVTFESDPGFELEEDAEDELKPLWDFLFVGIKRERLVKLDITETEKTTFPMALDIVTSCPNLTVLSLHFKTKNLNLPELWRGLPNLEQLTIDGGKGLRDADFVVKDEPNPVFWNLKRLNMFNLTLQKHAKLTDDLFSKVLCHMPLKNFSLRSCRKVDLITLDGVKELLNGLFANTIEKLSLNFSSYSSEEERCVEKMFRSSRMM